MKNYIEKEIPAQPARKERVLENTTCDICKKVIVDEPDQINDVSVCCRTGTCYRNGAFGQEISTDICVDCFTNRLVPWLKSQGADIEWENWEY